MLDLITGAIGLHVKYLQLKAMKLVLASHHSSDLMVYMAASWTNKMKLDDYKVFIYSFLLVYIYLT